MENLHSLGQFNAEFHQCLPCKPRPRQMPNLRLRTMCQLEPQAAGRKENREPVRQALQGWRAGKPPRPVQRLDESKELPPRDLAEGSVTLSKGEVGSVGRSQASPWAVESPLQELPVKRRRLQVDRRSLAVLCNRRRRKLHRV